MLVLGELFWSTMLLLCLKRNLQLCSAVLLVTIVIIFLRADKFVFPATCHPYPCRKLIR